MLTEQHDPQNLPSLLIIRFRQKYYKSGRGRLRNDTMLRRAIQNRLGKQRLGEASVGE
jgi:hypothetical protein